MAGEIIKGSVYLNNLGNTGDAIDGLHPFSNSIGGENLSTNQFNLINSIDNNDSNVNVDIKKLPVSLTKQFTTKQVTFDVGVPAVNVENVILDAINTWCGTYGYSYDDIIITINTSGGGTHDVMVCIIRYF